MAVPPTLPLPLLTVLRRGVVLLLLAVLPVTARAQSVTYTTVTRGEFGGSLGTIMQAVPGAQSENRETVYLKGALMRTDSEDSSTIVDAGQGMYTVVDHEDENFFRYSLDEMMTAMSAQMGEMEAQQEAAMADMDRREDSDVSFEVKISTDRTGRTMDMGGFPAEQFLLVLEMVPTSEEAVEAAEESGTMAVVTELWMTQEMPGWKEFQEAQAEMASQAAGASDANAFAAAIQQALATDPRMEEAFDKNMEAMQEMDGVAVKTVVNFVMIPPEQELDREQVLAMASEPLSAGMGEVVADAAADAAKEEAADAARGALRGLSRGLLGRGRDEPEEKEEEAAPAPVQSILMRMTSSVEEIRTDPLSDDLFQPPAGYTEIAPPWQGMGGGS